MRRACYYYYQFSLLIRYARIYLYGTLRTPILDGINAATKLVEESPEHIRVQYKADIGAEGSKLAALTAEVHTRRLYTQLYASWFLATDA